MPSSGYAHDQSFGVNLIKEVFESVIGCTGRRDNGRCEVFQVRGVKFCGIVNCAGIPSAMNLSTGPVPASVARPLYASTCVAAVCSVVS